MNKTLGATLLIVGVEIGSGIIVMPAIIAHMGLLIGSLVLFIVWSISIYTALLLVDINASVDGSSSFFTLAKSFYNSTGVKVITTIFLITMYSVEMAYISAAASTMTYYFHIGSLLSILIFTTIFGWFVVNGVHIVELINRYILFIKLIFLIISIILLFNVLRIDNLQVKAYTFTSTLAFFPALFTTFIMHSLVPSLSKYLNNNATSLKKAIIFGNSISLLLYLLWIIAIIGSINNNGEFGFAYLFNKGLSLNVDDILKSISSNSQINRYTIIFVNIIVSISVITSFLGVSTAVYDFIKDLLKRKNTILDNTAPAIVTFLIPAIIVINYPNLLIFGLNLAGAGVVLLFFIFPILCAKRLIKYNHSHSQSMYLIRYFILLISLSVLAIQILNFCKYKF